MLDQFEAYGGERGQPARARVFISYSRKDGAFAEKLRVALIAAGYEAYLDKEDILPGEPWRARLEGLILAADAVVFVISPDSVGSEHCRWEVERTLELTKNLVPLLWRAIPSEAVPEGLSERNYVPFDAYERSGDHCQGARPHRVADAARPRRRGDRMNSLRTHTLLHLLRTVSGKSRSSSATQ